ncbi:MAG: 4Fe-4S binding protein [Lachnospiraceae bacterium]|nr:4Fe-4S binding protein [Lachnospiraceae bacterium]
MEISKVTAIYFSATGTNKRSVCTIAQEFVEKIETVDVTMWNSVEQERTFEEEELVVIGAPVYGGRIYEGARERFTHFHGKNTPCIVTVTYGNRHYDDALLELADLMKTQGFRVVAGAALIGQHTYGDIQKGRPNEQDLEEDRIFAKKVKEKLQNSDWQEPHIPGNSPYKDGGNGGAFRPLTNEKCVGCGICVAKCPQGAIQADCKTIDDKCIACFRCIQVCPVKAKNMDTPEYIEFAENFSKRLEARRENEWFFD